MASLAHPYRLAFRLQTRAEARPRPEHRTAQPTLAKGERVLAHERDTRTRRRVVATQHAVYHQDLDHGFDAWQRLGWDQVDRADWDPQRGELRLVSLVGPSTPDLTVRLPRPGRLLDVARERIHATTVLRVPLRHAGQVIGQVSARRTTANDHELAWVVRLRPGAQLTDPELAEAIHNVKAEAGL